MSRLNVRRPLAPLGLALLLAGLAACKGGGDGHEGSGQVAQSGGQVITIDGSSTVFPISAAMAEDFQEDHDARITVARSGTGGGFEKLCRGEIDIAGASRPIKPTEVEACTQAHIDYIELPVAYDGIAVVVNRENTWAQSITVDELKRMWEPPAQGVVRMWRDVRPDWPDEELHLFGPGVDSGTYDYFTKAIVGEEHASRGDFTSSEDDNVLVQGIVGDRLALGYFGYAYYVNNTDRLRVLTIDDGVADNGAGPIEPTPETIANNTYQPLARPIFIYVSRSAADRPEVAAFVDYYLAQATETVTRAHYVALPPRAYELAAARFQRRTTGSIFAGGGSQIGVTVEALLEREQ